MTSTIKLSALDRAAPQVYRRYGFIFLMGDDDVAIAKAAVDRKIHQLVTQMPVLAGTINDGSISMTLSQNGQFSVPHLTIPSLDLAAISQAGMLAHHFASEVVTPRPDQSDDQSSPVFAVQAHCLSGGLLLVMYLHHRAADHFGISNIVREMSEGLGTRTLSLEDLQEEATEATIDRAILSQTNGATAFFARARVDRLEQQQQQHTRTVQPAQTAHIDETQLSQLTNTVALSSTTPNNRTAMLSFRLHTISAITSMSNSRLARIDQEASITDTDVLIAILWRAFARAKYPSQATYPESAKCSISFEVDVRAAMSLSADYFGNASITATAFESVLSLAGRYDHFEIEKTAIIIHEARVAAASVRVVRSRIALLNDDPSAAKNEATADFIIEDFTACQPELEDTECDLGLGLGMPVCVRKVGRSLGSKEAVILPKNKECGWWEVQIEMEGTIMKNLLMDVPLREYLWHVAH